MRKTRCGAIVWPVVLAVCFGAAAQGTTEAAGDGQTQAPSPSTAKVRIEIGDIPGNHPGAEWFMHQVELFREAHPEIDVRAFGIGGDARASRPLETLPDLAENVIGVESMTGGEAAYLAERGLIVPVDRFLPDPEFGLDAFDKNLYDSVTYAGKTWGVPWYVEGAFLTYDPAMLRDVGIDRPPQTWKELLADVERLGTDANGDGQPEQWGLRISSPNTFLLIWISMLLQQDVHIMDETGFHVEGEAPRDAFDLLRRLASSPKVRMADAKTSEPCAFSFETSRSIEGALTEMASQKLRIAPLPGPGNSITLRTRGIYLCVRKSTPEREAASWRFVKWVVRKDAPLPERFEGYLCRADVSRRPDFNQVPLADKTNIDAALRSVADTVDPAPHLTGRLLAFGFLRESFNAAIQGKVSYEEGVVQAARKVNALTKSRAKADDALELVR